jgi:hypothetical protein
VDIMKASQVAEAIKASGFAYGLTGNEEVVTHSRGTSWVARTGTGHYITVTLTEGGKHVVAVGPSSYGQPKAKKTEVPVRTFTLGYIKVGRNTLQARIDDETSEVQRLDRDGNWVAYTGTAKFNV